MSDFSGAIFSNLSASNNGGHGFVIGPGGNANSTQTITISEWARSVARGAVEAGLSPEQISDLAASARAVPENFDQQRPKDVNHMLDTVGRIIELSKSGIEVGKALLPLAIAGIALVTG